jgi:hypothetical protein
MRPDVMICESDCPTGYTETDGVCTEPDNVADLDTCFTWDTKEIEIPSSNGGSQIALGANTETRPRVAYQRGLWFDGGDFLDIADLVLSNRFTLEFWVRLTSPGSLLTVTTSIITFSLSTNAKPQITDASATELVSSLIIGANWSNVGFTVDRTDVAFYLNGVLDDGVE